MAIFSRKSNFFKQNKIKNNLLRENEDLDSKFKKNLKCHSITAEWRLRIKLAVLGLASMFQFHL